MNEDAKRNLELEAIDSEASRWILRLDRGLTAKEQDDYLDWLGDDPRHGDAISKYKKDWSRLDDLAAWLPEHSNKPNPDLLAPSKDWFHIPKYVYAIAACFIIGFIFIYYVSINKPEIPAQVQVVNNPGNEQIFLDDGSIMQLNHNSSAKILYTESERKILLENGEAYFKVVHNPNQPFVVQVADYTVQAIGTAFSVKVGSSSLEILVEEGIVQLNDEAIETDTDSNNSFKPNSVNQRLLSQQLAVVPLEAQNANVQLADLTENEIKRVFAWQHRMLNFNDQALDEIVLEFNRLNEVQLVIEESDLNQLRISGSIRSDNIDGFLRLLDIGFEIQAEQIDFSTIKLKNYPN